MICRESSRHHDTLEIELQQLPAVPELIGTYYSRLDRAIALDLGIEEFQNKSLETKASTQKRQQV
jgi:hypothetical protein